MTIAGNLRTMGVGDLIQWLAASRKTGTLIIDGPEFTKKLFFRQGDVVAVASDNPKEMLGHYLVGWGLCTPPELESLIKSQESEPAMLGELAVKKGSISPDDLSDVVTVKTQETLFDLILWESGDFRFIERDFPDKNFQEVPLPVTSFLFEGHRQKDERQQMLDLVPDTTNVPILIALPEGLNDTDMALVTQMDGRGSIEEIALANRRTVFDTLKLVHTCVKSGLMQVHSSGKSPTLSDQITSPWMATERQITALLGRGRFLSALKLINEEQENYPADQAFLNWVSEMFKQIEQALNEEKLGETDFLELGIELDDLVKLDCDPAEGFVLSRITGLYTVEQVLRQLPGSRLNNRVIIHNLIRRGLIKPREATSVRRFQDSQH